MIELFGFASSVTPPDESPRVTCTPEPVIWLRSTTSVPPSSLTVGVLLYRAYDWLRRSGWDATVPQRQIALKQRIDFALAGLAVIVLFHQSALLSLVPWRTARMPGDASRPSQG